MVAGAPLYFSEVPEAHDYTGRPADRCLTIEGILRSAICFPEKARILVAHFL